MAASAQQSVSYLSILCMVVSLLVCIGLPVGLAIWAKRRYREQFSFLPMLAGALAFFASQAVFRIPMLQMVLPLFGWYKKFMTMQWPYVVFLCITAGLVEESARFIAFLIMKKRRQFPDGLSYGIGHGGFEAVYLIGLTFVNNIILSLMINAGLTGKMPISAATINALVSAPSYTFLVGGLERIFAVTVQIGLSFVVLKGFQKNRRALYLMMAILLHAALDFFAAAAQALGLGIWVTEGIVALEAVIMALYILKQAKAWKRNAQPAGEPAAA